MVPVDVAFRQQVCRLNSCDVQVQVSHFRLATVQVCAVLCHHTTYYNRTTGAVSPRTARSPTPPQRSRIRSPPAIRGRGRGFGRRRVLSSSPPPQLSRSQGRFGRCRMPILPFWMSLWAVLNFAMGRFGCMIGRFEQRNGPFWTIF